MNCYRNFNIRWVFRDARRIPVMACRARQPLAASQRRAVALASKPQAASLGCIQDEEEPEWKKRRGERRNRRRTLSNHGSGASEVRRRMWAHGQRVVLRTHLSTASKPGSYSGRGGGGVEETCMLYSTGDRDTSPPGYFLVLGSTMLLSDFYGFRSRNYPATF